MRDKKIIFTNLHQTLQTVRLGLEDLLESKADRKTSGL